MFSCVAWLVRATHRFVRSLDKLQVTTTTTFLPDLCSVIMVTLPPTLVKLSLGGKQILKWVFWFAKSVFWYLYNLLNSSLCKLSFKVIDTKFFLKTECFKLIFLTKIWFPYLNNSPLLYSFMYLHPPSKN